MSEPIWKLLTAGDPDRLRAYLAENPKQADIRSPRGRSPLRLAVEANEPQLAAVLIEAGAEVDGKTRVTSKLTGKTSWGETPLMLARSLRMITTLVKAGADVNAQDDTGKTVLMHLALTMDTTLADAVRAAGARAPAEQLEKIRRSAQKELDARSGAMDEWTRKLRRMVEWCREQAA